MPEVACRADLCYNEAIKYVVAAMLETSRDVRRTLLGGSSMDILRPTLFDDNPLKRCSKCHIAKDTNQFHRNRHNPDGLQHYCKACRKLQVDEKELERVRTYYHNIAGTGKIPAEKLCRTCNRVLPAKEFTRWKYSKTGLVSQCKECHKKKHAYRAVECARKRRLSQPGFNRDQKNKRKALKRGAPRIEAISRRKVYERDNGKCYMCGIHLPFNKFELEHVIPLIRGGCHTYDNVKVACRSCNARKHTKLLEEL